MVIGIFVWDLNISGGTQRQALELALKLQDLGHDVTVYKPIYDAPRCYPGIVGKLVIRVLSPGPEKNPRFLQPLLYFWHQLFINDRRYKKVARQISANLDILCCDDSPAYAVGAQFKKMTGIPVVLQMNDCPIKKIAVTSSKAFLKKLASPALGRVWFDHRHLGYLRAMDRIVVIDNLNKNQIKRDFGLDSLVIRNGLDLSQFSFRRRPPRKKGLRLMANGIFFPWRRFEDLLAALAILRSRGIPFSLDHVGTDVKDKTYAAQIYNMVKDLGLSSSVTFHGHAADQMLLELYQNADIFIFPNSPQTWGLAVFEAMGCGTPVILTSGCGAAEVLTDKENALIVPPLSPDRIAEAIIQLESNSLLWEKLSVNGRQFVEKNITWGLYAQRMVEVFQVIASKSRTGSAV